MSSLLEIRSPIGESSKDAPLIEDIRLLGQILGETIREQEGEIVFAQIENIRRLSVAFERDADLEGGRRLDAVLRALTAEEAILVARAFSYFSHLANIADDGTTSGGEKHTSKSRWRRRKPEPLPPAAAF